MNVTDWNAIADAYFDVDDPHERPVLNFIREKLATLQPKRLLDYGGGRKVCRPVRRELVAARNSYL